MGVKCKRYKKKKKLKILEIHSAIILEEAHCAGAQCMATVTAGWKSTRHQDRQGLLLPVYGRSGLSGNQQVLQIKMQP